MPEIGTAQPSGCAWVWNYCCGWLDVVGFILHLMILMISYRVSSARSAGSDRFHVDSFHFVIVFPSLVKVIAMGWHCSVRIVFYCV